MNKRGINEQTHCTAYSSQVFCARTAGSSVTPIHKLIKIPKLLEMNKLLRLESPVRKANKDASIFSGINLAYRTLNGS